MPMNYVQFVNASFPRLLEQIWDVDLVGVVAVKINFLHLVASASEHRFQGAAGAYGRGFTRLRFGAGSDRRADEARERILIALDELEIRLGAGEYLVGDRFTAADLTAASLFYPMVLPPEGPKGIPQSVLAELTEPLAGRRGLRWVREMFRRHRRRWSTGLRSDVPGERLAS